MADFAEKVSNSGNPEAVAVAKDRLSALKRAASDGEIHLLFADEADASSHPYLARAWAKRGADLRVQAPGTAVKRAIFGAHCHASGQLVAKTAPRKDSEAFCDFVQRLKPADGKPVHLVLDNASIHRSRKTRAALGQADWLNIEWLPGYTPELNDIERDWRHLKCHYLAHQTFRDVDSLDLHIHAGILAMNKQRRAKCGWR